MESRKNIFLLARCPMATPNGCLVTLFPTKSRRPTKAFASRSKRAAKASQVSPDQWASLLAASQGLWASHLVACLLAVPDRASPERDQWVSHPVECHLVRDLAVLLLTAALATCSATLFRGTSEQRCHEWVNPSKRAGPLSDRDWVMIKLLG